MPSPPPTVPVYLFNCAGGIAYTLRINGAQQGVLVYATSSSAQWNPGTSLDPAYLLLDGTEAPGYFTFGTNQLTVSTYAAKQEFPIAMNVPDPSFAISALQLYLFFTSFSKPPYWALLVDGFLVDGNVSLSGITR